MCDLNRYRRESTGPLFLTYLSYTYRQDKTPQGLGVRQFTLMPRRNPHAIHFHFYHLSFSTILTPSNTIMVLPSLESDNTKSFPGRRKYREMQHVFLSSQLGKTWAHITIMDIFCRYILSLAQNLKWLKISSNAILKS